MVLSDQALFLKNCVPVFSPAPDEELAVAAEQSEILWLPPQRTAVVRGELLTKLYIVASGSLMARYKALGGFVELLLREGDLFGERALTSEPVSDCAVKTTQEVLLLALRETAVRTVLERNLPFRERLTYELSLRRRTLAAAVVRPNRQERPASSPSLS